MVLRRPVVPKGSMTMVLSSVTRHRAEYDACRAAPGILPWSQVGTVPAAIAAHHTRCSISMDAAGADEPSGAERCF